MRGGFFLRMAWTGIRKNKKLYLPWFLTCVGMVTVYYILEALHVLPVLGEMRGGGTLLEILNLGRYVLAVFALIFLFYTNSFLVRRRYREFGLYNILGMDKRGIARVLAWESVTVSLGSLVCGVAIGGALSKAAELILVNIVHGQVDYGFSFPLPAVGVTAAVFGVIFLLLFLRSLITVGRTDPLALFQSEHYGEKPPRARWLLTLIGLGLLAGAYYIAMTIQTPTDALMFFFLAVIMVIAATYLLLTVGSVTLCRLLQRNKGYYYQKRHFVSVSNMAYRMKRNGAGLASICILCTMVLVTVCSCTSLYIGVESAMRDRYGVDAMLAVEVAWADDSPEQEAAMQAGYRQCFTDFGVAPKREEWFRYVGITCMLQNGEAILQGADTLWNYGDLCELLFITDEEYSHLSGSNLRLRPGQALLYTQHTEQLGGELTVNGQALEIVGRITALPEVHPEMESTLPTLLLVVPDLDLVKGCGSLRYFYGYDLNAPDEVAIALYSAQKNAALAALPQYDTYVMKTGCAAGERADFYAVYGGLFFIGIVLSGVFICAAALIIYYKQICEGYEDQAWFDIMQKVGMTLKDIRQSIDSQVLTVFFIPLLLAGVHLAFAFPMVWKILQLFGLSDLGLVIRVNLAAFAAFGLFYIIVYRITAGAYFRIVSAVKQE